MADAKTVTRDSITIVEPVPKKPLTKIISLKNDKIVIDGRSNMASRFSYREVFFTSFATMAKAFEAVAMLVDEAQTAQQLRDPNRRGAMYDAIAEQARLIKEVLRAYREGS